MTKIFCEDVTCKNCKNGVCLRKSIKLSHISTITCSGRQMFNKCQEREDSKEFSDIKLKLYELLIKENNTHDEHGKGDN